MEIKSIEIGNYRSVKDFSLILDPISDKKCFIFVWINESGKSNILKAISLLNDDSEWNYNKDCFRDVKYKESVYVSYNLKFNEKHYIEQINTNIPEDLISKLAINKIEYIITIDNDDDPEKQQRYNLDLKFDLNKDYVWDSDKNFKKISEIYSWEEVITKDNITELIPWYSIITHWGLTYFLRDKITQNLKQNTPKCRYWKYGSKHIIGKEIPLNDFKEDQSISIPLRNIFLIAWIKNKDLIKKEIEIIEKDRDYRYKSSKKLSDSVTSHIRSIRKEHQIEIEVKIEDSMDCHVIVKDIDDPENSFNMTERSEWFQHFVSILLNLSAENKTNLLENNIIILDEPEVHLHPSWVKFLRDELLKISEKNIVIIATHSIYMVDKENLDRHFKVEKNNNITVVEQIERENPLQEEVIYEALWTSVLEHIEPNVLIFEWKTDRDIFQCFSKKFQLDFKPLNLSYLSADWAENMHKYTKFFSKKLLKWFVLVDFDKYWLDAKDRVLKNNNFWENNTFDINDIVEIKKGATLEDLLPVDIIIGIFSKMYALNIDIDNNLPIMKQIKDKLIFEKKFDKKDNLKTLKSEIIKYIITDVSNKKNTRKNIEEKYPTYHNFVEVLHEKMKKFK